MTVHSYPKLIKQTDKDFPVLIPGDKERSHKKVCDENGGILYPKVLIDSMNTLAQRLKIKPMEIVNVNK